MSQDSCGVKGEMNAENSSCRIWTVELLRPLAAQKPTSKPPTDQMVRPQAHRQLALNAGHDAADISAHGMLLEHGSAQCPHQSDPSVPADGEVPEPSLPTGLCHHCCSSSCNTLAKQRRTAQALPTCCCQGAAC